MPRPALRKVVQFYAARWTNFPPPLTNAVVETFFKTLKAELIWRSIWQTRRQTEAALFEYINGFYNPRRRHLTLGGKSPLAFETVAV